MGTPEEKLKLLFVCVGNSCRSQMAEGWARAMGGAQVEVHSAGSLPARFVADGSILAMQEAGINISAQYSKGLKEVPPGPYDAVVTMGCGDACPWIPATKRFDWNIEDPIGQGIEKYREVRDVIKGKMDSLLEELGVLEKPKP